MSLSDTAITLRDEMLEELPEEWDTNTGSIFWNIISALAVAAGEETDRLTETLALRDPAQMSGSELEVFCARYGIYREDATEATCELTITLDAETTSVDIPDGTLFETESGVQFSASQDYYSVKSGDTIEVHAVVAGASGNVDADTITVIPVTLEGVDSVTNATASTGGMDAEDDSDLFERWQIKVAYRVTGYNKGWYEAKALEQSDVGYAKCYAAGETISGGKSVPENWVYLVVLDDDHNPMSTSRIAELQEEFDPDPQGTGLGLTPATAFCQIVNGIEENLVVTVTGVVSDGTYTLDEIAEYLHDYIVEYFANADVYQTIYAAEIFAMCMDIDGVLTLDPVTINGESSYTLAYNGRAMLGGVSLTDADGNTSIYGDTDYDSGGSSGGSSGDSGDSGDSGGTTTTTLEITNQPESVTINAGEAATFAVAANGDDLSYQWYVSTNSGTSWTALTALSDDTISGAETATLTISSVSAAASGYLLGCEITDGSGNTVTSDAVTLTVVAFEYTVATADGASYGFTLGSDGYYKSTNTSSGTTAASTITFAVYEACSITMALSAYHRSSGDISNVYALDSTSTKTLEKYNINGSWTDSLNYTLTAGTHVINLLFYNSAGDITTLASYLKFKVVES